MIRVAQKVKRLINNLAAIRSEVSSLQKTTDNYHVVTHKLLVEINWCNVFNSAVIGSSWFKDVPLNVGRWAGNYSFFYVLFRILNEVKPQNILELGLGESTKMVQAYIKNNNHVSTCISIEHSEEWIELKRKSGITDDYINLVQVDLIEELFNGCQTLRYKNLTEVLTETKRKFNLVIVDGPFGSNCFSRSNIIDIVQSNFLDEEFIIIMDDADRKGEVETLQALKEALNGLHYEYHVGNYSGEKSQTIIASKSLQYLTSL